MKRHSSLFGMLIAGCLVLSGCRENTRGHVPQSRAEQSRTQSPNGGDSAPASGVDKPSDPTATTGPESTKTGPDGAAIGATANSAPPVGEGPLSVRIESLASNSIDFDNPFDVVVTNNSDQPIRIWNPRTQNGYYQVSFHFTNSQSGERYVARKRVIEGNGFWELGEQDNPAIVIAPRQSFTIPVKLIDFAWGELAWTGLPGPNSQDRFAVSVQFESKAEHDADRPQVWTGTMRSDSVTVRLVATRLKTPHDYLWYDFSKRAIEIMSADPTWVAARSDDECTPLHHAARFGHADAVKWLLDHGADVNAIAYNGLRPCT